jgi:hypothetical protein
MEKIVADNEKDNPSDVSIEGDNADVKKLLGLPLPLLIKISIGVIIILIAVGGYFFFMADNDLSANDATAEEVIEKDSLFFPSDNDSSTAKENTAEPADSASKIMDYREQSMSFREENLQLRERIFQLESELSAVKNKTQQSAGSASVSVSERKTDIDTSLMHNYGDNSQTFPPIITDPPKPRPEPKWGEFERPK